MNAKNKKEARSKARRFADRWETDYPDAVKCLRNDMDLLSTCWRCTSLDLRKQV